MGFWPKFTREAQIRHQNKFLMDSWLLASPYGSYGSPAVPYREASGSYGRWAVNLWPSTITAQCAALRSFAANLNYSLVFFTLPSMILNNIISIERPTPLQYATQCSAPCLNCFDKHCNPRRVRLAASACAAVQVKNAVLLLLLHCAPGLVQLNTATSACTIPSKKSRNVKASYENR